MKVHRIILLLLLLAIGLPVLVNAQDSIPLLEKCKSCVYAVGGKAPSTSSVLLKMAGIVVVIVLATLFGWFTYHKKRYIFFGSVATLLVIGSYVFAIEKYKNKEYPVQSCDSTICITDSLNAVSAIDSLNPFVADEFLPAGGEFENLSEFTTASDDEFSEVSSELNEFSDNESEVSQTPIDKNLLYQTIVLLMLSAIIGLTIKYRLVRNSRGLILLASIIYLGFVRGACPCMIMSLHQVILFILGNPVTFISMLWFLGLVVVTYFFGKTWCGWLCHLGALQDVLFRAPGRKWLTTEKSQRIIKYIQIGLLVVLIVQLVITRSIIFVKYDPFKVAYNLFSSNITGYILLVLLLVSSVLIYRPFCRIACPVGLLLGWVTKISGAKKLVIAESGCSNCKSCVRSCKQQAIHSVDAKIKINTEDCILCGDCIGTCKKGLLSVKRNSI
jgi:NAD-dependent dihydropyrimidine dehydrogenase PreA subunit